MCQKGWQGFSSYCFLMHLKETGQKAGGAQASLPGRTGDSECQGGRLKSSARPQSFAKGVRLNVAHSLRD